MPIQQVNENKTGFYNLAGSSQGGIPLGTWASFEGDYAPNIEWLRGGTSFNANTYPALAMYLGGTTVPERFDHNRLGEWETATISADSNNPTVMQYDGYLTVKDIYTSNNGYSSIFVDGVSVNQVNMAGATGDATYNADGTIIPFKKGQSIYILTYNARGTERHIAYYKHPLFIKATPTSSDSDYEGTLNGIRQYVSNSNSYSTEEKWTGGYWIDGKKIYRLVSVADRILDGSDVQVAGVFSQAIANAVDTMIKFTAVGGRSAYPGQSGSSPMTATFNAWQSTSDNKNIYCNASNRIYSTSVIVEYTKTTE